MANAGNFRFLSASSKVTRSGLAREGAMSKARIGIAVVVLATMLSSAALARVRLAISPLGVARFAVTRVLSVAGLHHARGFARYGRIRTASLRPQDVRNVMDSGIGNPALRRQFIAAAALAG